MEIFERLTCPDPIARAWCGPLRPWVPKKKAFSRLVFYEDTGLAPEEITTEKPACVFYCNRKCNLDGDWCSEGPGCPKEVDSETAMRWLSPQPDVALTLAELREMDGEPVWGAFSEGSGRYMIIQWHNSEFFKTFECGFLLLEEYEKTWMAYRRKPEENTTMKILKPGDLCPCCGQPIKEGLPSETIMLLSWLQERKNLLAATKGVNNESTDN